MYVYVRPGFNMDIELPEHIVANAGDTVTTVFTVTFTVVLFTHQFEFRPDTV